MQASITLSWHDLSYSISDKKAADDHKWILHPQSGEACPGSLIAIMGPSGSGKTSLLNALAGRLPITKNAQFSGSLQVNGVAMRDLPCPFADVSAYVEQDDALFALSTVQETLEFSARLRLPWRMSKKERSDRIDDVLRQLGLFKARNTNVGGNSANGVLRGISGGERKRLSIAIELLHKPRCIFLDEPTSGLDSYQSLNVIQNMRSLADDGHTILTSIHQPRSSIFALMSGVYLLAAGKPVYVGAAETVPDYFMELGFKMPEKFNPADFIIDLVSVNQRDEEEQAKTEAQLASLQNAWAAQSSKLSRSDSEEVQGKQSILNAKVEAPAGQHSFFMPFVLLLQRAWVEQARDKFAILFKIFALTVLAVLFGVIYWQLDMSQKSIQDRTGVLFFLTMNQAFGAVISTSQVIPRQLAVVRRERANRLYSIFPFYLASLIVTIPIESLPVLANGTIVYYMADLNGSFPVFFGLLLLENAGGISLGMFLSACFDSVTMAPNIAPLAVIVFLLFNGFMINEDSIPVYFKWLREVSFIRYAFKGVVVNEFQDVTFACDLDPCIPDGKTYLSRLSFDGDGIIGMSVLLLAMISIGFNVLGYAVLLYKRPCFLALKDAENMATDSSSKVLESGA